MAEIPVHPKRGVPAWVWILAAIVILAILWFAFGRRDNTSAATSGRTVPAHVAPEPAAPAPVAAAALV